MWSGRSLCCILTGDGTCSAASYCCHGCQGHRCNRDMKTTGIHIMLSNIPMLEKWNIPVLYLFLFQWIDLEAAVTIVVHRCCLSHNNLLSITISITWVPRSTTDSITKLTLYLKEYTIVKMFHVCDMHLYVRISVRLQCKCRIVVMGYCRIVLLLWAAVGTDGYWRRSLRPSFRPERRHRSNTLRISAISQTFGGMMYSTMKQITIKMAMLD